MFDHYHRHHSTSEVYKTVTEKRAPTDESIRLLREMEAKATEQVIKSQKLDNNLITATLWHYKDHLTWKEKYKVLAKINGKTIDIDIELNDNEDQFTEIFNAVARRLAAELLNTAGKIKEA
jgi:hypothetical protein